MSSELKEIKDTLEQYILYLKIGAFKHISVKEDILLCRNTIKEIDDIFSTFHSKKLGKIYREYANIYRQVLFSEKEISSDAIVQCEKVIENPNYENCKILEYMLSQIYYSDEYDGVTAEDDEQEKVHREMYYNIKNKMIFLNICS